jgi:hypothetical protein
VDSLWLVRTFFSACQALRSLELCPERASSSRAGIGNRAHPEPRLRAEPHHSPGRRQVTLVNNDTVQHELMFDKWTWDFRYVDPGLILKPGEQLTQTFTALGTFAYHCRRHSWIKGTVTTQ